jgi:hypothetical protein
LFEQLSMIDTCTIYIIIKEAKSDYRSALQYSKFVVWKGSASSCAINSCFSLFEGGSVDAAVQSVCRQVLQYNYQSVKQSCPFLFEYQ